MNSVGQVALGDSVAPATPALASPSGASRRPTIIVGAVAMAFALLSAIVTFLVLTGVTPVEPTPKIVTSVLLANGAAVLVLLALIARELWQVLQARRRGSAGARLHGRIVGLFSAIAAVPAILLAVIASVTLDRGLDHWFSTRTRAVIANSLTVAQAYLREHGAMIRGDILAMAIDVSRAKPLFDQDRERFRQFLNAQASIRGLPAAMILRRDLGVVERAELQFTRNFVGPTSEGIAQINETEPDIVQLPDTDYVAAIIKLRGYEDMYLYVARPLNPAVLEQLRTTEKDVAEYASLEARRLGVQVAFGLMYTVVALIVLLCAVWIGFNFAAGMVAPIRRLIGAANLVAGGNLFVQVPVRRAEGDLAQLGETFNKMTQELRTQHDDLMRARDVIDSRRRFTEAVLSGASAGVIGVDPDGRITLMNRSAEKLIGCAEAEALRKPLAAVVPELVPLLDEARSGLHRLVHGQATISRNGNERNLSVRVTTEQSGESEHGYVVTLDDITELVAAQRSSAWADIARRIAHEIKNPLTPIQLSAERLRRKYGKVIQEDRAVFEQCTDTIVRQVDDIKRMVDEFSRFARMPKPVMTEEDVADTVRQVVFMMRVGHPDVEIDVETTEDPMRAHFDRRLISQALTNIVKNASEAIAAVPEAERGRGRIRVRTARENGEIVIDVIDNGLGLPKENRNRLLEPYVTTREKGTGLGLAIVGKILEEHGGRLELFDAPEVAQGGRGAWIRLRFTADVARTVVEHDEEENLSPAPEAAPHAERHEAANEG
jgi:two-component system, NtrC family, nitrogen regulation sensor histidine kinase NtrY